MNNPLYPTNDGRLSEDRVALAEPAPDQELADMFLAYPWLKTLEPFYVEWELIWLM